MTHEQTKQAALARNTELQPLVTEAHERLANLTMEELRHETLKRVSRRNLGPCTKSELIHGLLRDMFGSEAVRMFFGTGEK